MTAIRIDHDAIEITADNLADYAEAIVRDQADELEVGCHTWTFTYDEGSFTGRITVWPNGRAAICHNGDSEWGDWDSKAQRLVLDEVDEDGRPIEYDASGELYDPAFLIAEQIRAWDKQDISVLHNLIRDLDGTVCSSQTTDEYVDFACLPSAELPDDVAAHTHYPVWAADVHGNLLVGQGDLCVVTLEAFRDEIASRAASIRKG